MKSRHVTFPVTIQLPTFASLSARSSDFCLGMASDLTSLFSGLESNERVTYQGLFT
jgi:hypothetical protein